MTAPTPPPGAPPVRLLTVGHGTLSAEAFASLVVGAGIDLLVDVRSYPGSRRSSGPSSDSARSRNPQRR